jgi:hypothetical protein
VAALRALRGIDTVIGGGDRERRAVATLVLVSPGAGRNDGSDIALLQNRVSNEIDRVACLSAC